MTYTASEKLWGKYYKKFENSIKTENKTIYHYTSSDSMCKILSNKCIWFSNANYLNDESERTYIYRLLKRRVEKHKLNDSFKKEVLEICAMMESDEDSICYASTMYNLKNKFIASFSLNQDSLSLWNYYTKDNNMLGYNIGFNLKKFISSTNKLKQYYLHGKVIYNTKEQFQILDLMLNDYCEEFCKFLKYDEQVHRSFLIAEFMMILHIFGLFFKHPAYALEEEYRFIYEPTTKVKYRQKAGLFIPYIELPFDTSAVNSIKISPTQKDEIVKNSLIDMLHDKGYSNINISKSNIPLRY